MKVSVILPIYNGEKTLDATLKSLAAQTFQDFELVACIDGTKDGSEGILETYKNIFSSLTILKNQNNLGLGPTMNRLVSNSNGEYIAIAEQVDLLVGRTDLALVSGIVEFWNGEKVTSKFSGILVYGAIFQTLAAILFKGCGIPCYLKESLKN